jgi:hypothetical protein
MFIKQISVFIENKSGRISDIASILEKKGVNIRALSLADSADFGILRLIVDKADEACEALNENDVTARLTDVVAVEVEDCVGGFAKAMKIIDEAGINVEYMYAFVEKKHDNAILIIRFEDIQNAVKTLLDGGLKILKAKEALFL